MDLFENHGYCLYKEKTNSFLLLNFDYPKLKSVRKNFNICNQTVEKNLLMLYLKAFTIRKTSPLVIQQYTYIKKM